jgi:hypothetical protein
VWAPAPKPSFFYAICNAQKKTPLLSRARAFKRDNPTVIFV